MMIVRIRGSGVLMFVFFCLCAYLVIWPIFLGVKASPLILELLFSKFPSRGPIVWSIYTLQLAIDFCCSPVL